MIVYFKDNNLVNGEKGSIYEVRNYLNELTNIHSSAAILKYYKQNAKYATYFDNTYQTSSLVNSKFTNAKLFYVGYCLNLFSQNYPVIKQSKAGEVYQEKINNHTMFFTRLNNVLLGRNMAYKQMPRHKFQNKLSDKQINKLNIKIKDVFRKEFPSFIKNQPYLVIDALNNGLFAYNSDFIKLDTLIKNGIKPAEIEFEKTIFD